MHEIQKFNEDDPKAKKAIYTLFASQLILFAFRFTSNKMVAEEIVHDSLMKAFKNLKQFKDVEAIKAFLYLTTRHACIDYLRKAEREKQIMSDYKYIIQDNAEMEDAVQREQAHTELIAVIRQAMEEQPKKRKEAVEYLYKYNKQPKEVAELMKINVSGVYKHRDEFIMYLNEVKGIETKRLRFLHRS